MFLAQLGGKLTGFGMRIRSFDYYDDDFSCVVLVFNVAYAVKRARMPIVTTASVVNEPSVNPRTVDAGTRLVEVSVTELVRLRLEEIVTVICDMYTDSVV